MDDLLFAIWSEGQYLSIENARAQRFPRNIVAIARPRWIVYIEGGPVFRPPDSLMHVLREAPDTF